MTQIAQSKAAGFRRRAVEFGDCFSSVISRTLSVSSVTPYFP